MMIIKTQVVGLPSLKQLIKKVELLDEDPKFIRASVKKISKRVKDRINLGWKYHGLKHPTGRNLSQSVFYAVQNNKKGIVSSACPYAVFVEYGTKPHLLNNGKPVLVKSIVRGKGLQSWKMIVHKGSDPKYYFHKGLKDFLRLDFKKLIIEKLRSVD